jgi:hypothetical protein
LLLSSHHKDTNTTQKQYKHKKTLSKQNKNNMAGTKQYKRNTKAKTLKSEKINSI